MEPVSISVTEASRNFSDCINRTRYQGTSFLLHKNGTPVARILPADAAEAPVAAAQSVQPQSGQPQPAKKAKTAAELAESLRAVMLADEEFAAWRRDLDEARKVLLPEVEPW